MFLSEPNDSKMSVAIIGAGAAGLCTARHLKSAKNVKKLKIFEAHDYVGGTWVHKVGDQANESSLVTSASKELPFIKNKNSALYDSLKTNLLDVCMQFPDYSFRTSQEHARFVHHTEVCKYLENYCDHFDLRKFIEFNSNITEITKSDDPSEDRQKWTINGENFDKLIICNGHYKKPKFGGFNFQEISKIFKNGRIMHSYDYRNPHEIKKSGFHKIAVIGGSASAFDIILELQTVGLKVVHSCRGPLRKLELSKDTCDEPNKFTENGFVDKEGRDVNDVDLILFATGYDFDYKFLKSSPFSSSNFYENCQIKDLYLHLFSKHEIDNLAFIGIANRIIPFPFFDHQVRLIKHLWFEEKGIDKLSKITNLDVENYISKEKIKRMNLGLTKETHSHYMINDLQWEYLQEIDDILGKEKLDEEDFSKVLENREIYKIYYKWAWNVRATDPDNYKNLVLSDEDFEKFKILLEKDPELFSKRAGSYKK